MRRAERSSRSNDDSPVPSESGSSVEGRNSREARTTSPVEGRRASRPSGRAPLSNRVELARASAFDLDALTQIYNRSRSDYLIPMPMNRRKLADYVHNYDIDLRRSRVALLDGEAAGLIMFGQRGRRGWISRLGVYPAARESGLGRTLVRGVIREIRDANAGRHEDRSEPRCDEVVIEVIDRNEPALRLFEREGFAPVRDLLVTRRPPRPVDHLDHGAAVEMLGSREALALLEGRSDHPSWVTETASMRNAGNIAGMVARWPDGDRGWLVYQHLAYTLSRIVLHTEHGRAERVGRGLLQQLHWRHPLQDTTCENMSLHDAHWPAMRELGYLVAFVRREMRLDLRDGFER